MNKDTKNTNKLLANSVQQYINRVICDPSLAWQKLQVEFTTGKKCWLNIRKTNQCNSPYWQAKEKKKIISDAAMKWDDEWKKSDKSRVYTIQVHYEILENVGEEGKKGREYRSGQGITNARAQRNVWWWQIWSLLWLPWLFHGNIEMSKFIKLYT